MGLSEYGYDVGEIALRRDEYFWILPSKLVFSEIYIYSPWFSYKREKWRLIKDSYRDNSDMYLIFRLRRKVRSIMPKCTYIVELKLLTGCDPHFVTISTEEVNPDYGCEFKFLSTICSCGMTHIFSVNGHLKLFFNIEKKENIDNPIEITNEEISNEMEEDNPDENEEISSDEEDDEDEENTEQTMNSDGDGIREKKNVAKSKGTNKLAEHLKQILFDGEMSDAVLKVDGREFNIHKVILVARSPVFASMFRHDLAEKKSNEVDIPDCTAESFEVFLHFLYSGLVENLSASNVFNVYYAADKYRVDDLKEKCVKFMKRNLSVETIFDTIALALRHGERKLLKTATGYFSENIRKILKTVQWQQYIAENPTQANELLIKAHDV